MKMEEIQRVGRRCPCGKMVYGYNRKLKKPQEYCHGHDQLGKKHPYVKSGKDNPHYTGAACRTTRYYIKTQKPKPKDCDRCGLVTKELQLSNINKTPDSKNLKDWAWLCYTCQYPKRVNVGRLSDHLCECERKCGEFTLYGWDGKINRYVVGHNAAGKILAANWIPGTPDDSKYRARWHWWVKKYAYKPSNCPVCGRKLLANKAKTISRSGSYLRDKNDCIWTCRYGICAGKIEEGMIVK